MPQSKHKNNFFIPFRLHSGLKQGSMNSSFGKPKMKKTSYILCHFVILLILHNIDYRSFQDILKTYNSILQIIGDVAR